MCRARPSRSLCKSWTRQSRALARSMPACGCTVRRLLPVAAMHLQGLPLSHAHLLLTASVPDHALVKSCRCRACLHPTCPCGGDQPDLRPSSAASCSHAHAWPHLSPACAGHFPDLPLQDHAAYDLPAVLPADCMAQWLMLSRQCSAQQRVLDSCTLTALLCRQSSACLCAAGDPTEDDEDDRPSRPAKAWGRR